jgi:hypothetical protein
MNDRKQVNDFRNVMGEYDSYDISVFIEYLRNLQSEGWERIELEEVGGYDHDYYIVRVTKPAQKLTPNITPASTKKISGKRIAGWPMRNLRRSLDHGVGG